MAVVASSLVQMQETSEQYLKLNPLAPEPQIRNKKLAGDVFKVILVMGEGFWTFFKEICKNFVFAELFSFVWDGKKRELSPLILAEAISGFQNEATIESLFETVSATKGYVKPSWSFTCYVGKDIGIKIRNQNRRRKDGYERVLGELCRNRIALPRGFNRNHGQKTCTLYGT
jgi:hypothetical protein